MANGKIYNVQIDDTVGVTDSFQARFESVHLIVSNQERCKLLLEKEHRREEDIIDILIALHVSLEVGLNSLFRDITRHSIKKAVDEFKVAENIDGINFIDKVTLFIYNSTFDLSGKIERATEHHKVIGKLKDFSGIRNKLLHGHSVAIVIEGAGQRHSPLRENLTETFLKKQLVKYKSIMDDMIFFLESLDPQLSQPELEHYKANYLSYNFIPGVFLKTS